MPSTTNPTAKVKQDLREGDSERFHDNGAGISFDCVSEAPEPLRLTFSAESLCLIGHQGETLRLEILQPSSAG